MNEDKSNFSSILVGVAIGAAITYLFTTKSGQKIKEDLFEEGSKLLEKIQKELEESEGKLEETSENLHEKIDEAKDVIQDKIEEGIHTVQAVEENVQDVLTPVPPQSQSIGKKVHRFFSRRPSSTPES